jgi:hypothetical protein
MLFPLPIVACKEAKEERELFGSSQAHGCGIGVVLMNCYLCLVETGCDYQPAYALCQRCGAGICGEHLRELRTMPVAGLIDAHPIPKYSLICQRCYQAAATVTRPTYPPVENFQRRSAPSLRAFWRKHFRRAQPSPLPSESDAVILAERFLEQERNR